MHRVYGLQHISESSYRANPTETGSCVRFLSKIKVVEIKVPKVSWMICGTFSQEDKVEEGIPHKMSSLQGEILKIVN